MCSLYQKNLPGNLCVWTLIILIISLGCSKAAEEQLFVPETVFLTWQHDPTTTMTIDWHVVDENRPSTIEYRRIGSSDWKKENGEMFSFPFTDDRFIHRKELTGLQPDTRYEVRFGSDSQIYFFQTMPESLTRPVRFVAGGDAGGDASGRDRTRWTSEIAARYEPDFIVLGGDLAYGNGNPRAVEKWYYFLDIFHSEFSGGENRLVPMIASIGNHEIWGGRSIPDDLPLDYYEQKYGLMRGDAPYYNALFAFPNDPEEEYGVLDFGDYMSWIVLDSGERNDIAGKQTEWLEQVLADRTNVPYVYPVYHRGAYPTIRPFETGSAKEIRDHWVPLFEEYGVRVVFENHDHTYKRTYPMRNGEISPEDGIVYLGDGAWGVSTRNIADPHWYLERAAAQNHFILGTIDQNGHQFSVYNDIGELIDAYPSTSCGEKLSEEFKARNPDDPEWQGEVMPTRNRDRITEEPEYVFVTEEDSLALVAFYHSTGGDNWTHSTGWLTDPVSQWHGISVRSNGRIQRILLINNGLTGVLPEELVTLTGLDRIYLQGNSLEGELPKGMGNLTRLVRFYVQDNNLEGELPKDIGDMTSLEQVRMWNNNFTGSIPASIGKLTRLFELQLGNNRLSGEIPVELAQLRLLNILNLSNNRFSSEIPPDLGKMSFRLQQLNLAGNQLTGTLPRELGDLTFLNRLDVADNNLTGTIPYEITSLEYLEMFNTAGNSFQN